MNKEKSNKIKNGKIDMFRRKMTARMLLDVIRKGLIFFVACMILYVCARLFLRLWIWQGDELIYRILHTIYEYRLLVAIIIGMAGFFVIWIQSFLKVLGYLEVVSDATEDIQDEKVDLIELPSEIKEIENKMNQIKLKVNENRQTAKEAEQRKKDLIVYLAHDLKTPLTSVIGYLTLLRDENQISEELRKKYLSISLEKAERLEDLINEFFEITRFNFFSMVLELGRVNLTRMLEQITYEFKPMLSEKNLRCELHAPQDIMMRCDADKIQRVFDNLLRNAVNYSFEDSAIEITVTKTEKEITISFENQGNTIPQEKLSRIFEQFYRLDAARTTKSGGAGLGLAIAKEIAEAHGGTITAGSTDETIHFELTIPIL